MTGTCFEGPFGYENWRAFLAGQPTSSGGEVAVYSDSRFTSELITELGPFQLVNAIAFTPAGTVAPVFALRMNDHLPPDLATSLPGELFARKETVLDHYHGGGMYDEVAALLSLTHGVRMQAGPVTRRFDAGGDPRGRPVTPDEPPPSLLPRRGRPIIPGIAQEQREVQAGLIPSYPRLAPADALALIRAARSYQEAVWIADGDPQFAWLLLVSAVETAAARWFRATNTSTGTDAEVLIAAKADLGALLASAGGEELVSQVAAHIAQGLRAGYKFRTFLLTFAPAPPEPRPAAAWGTLDWRAKGLTDTLIKVYDHRSKALHESIPFPLPMCEPPMHFRNEAGENTLTETPGGGAMFASGGVWQHADTPMLLWTFEHLVRGALLNWWGSMAPGAAAAQEAAAAEPS